MTGQRRANWEAKLDAVIYAHRGVVAQMLDAEALTRRNEIMALRERLKRAEVRLTLQAVALILCGLGGILLAVLHG